jgi:S-formylglutathione hydrolase FrmB
MHTQSKCIIILPTTYKKKKRHFPVVYLLHGYSGNYSNWITKVPDLTTYSDEYNLIIVCPDGAYASWYFDSPVNDAMHYETYIGVEVPHYIDSAYRTIADKNHRAITGLSMGGHGALFIAWRHPESFSVAGSMSGGVDLKESVHRFEIEKVLGDTLQNSANWFNNSVLNIVEKQPTSPLSLIIDCGVDDIFIAGNRRLHQKLLSLKIPHEYIERPGTHSWEYWKYSVQFQLLFFKKLFDRS